MGERDFHEISWEDEVKRVKKRIEDLKFVIKNNCLQKTDFKEVLVQIKEMLVSEGPVIGNDKQLMEAWSYLINTLETQALHATFIDIANEARTYEHFSIADREELN